MGNRLIMFSGHVGQRRLPYVKKYGLNKLKINHTHTHESGVDLLTWLLVVITKSIIHSDVDMI